MAEVVLLYRRSSVAIMSLMRDDNADIIADMSVRENGEPASLMEPLLVSDAGARRAGLPDLALQLAQESAAFRSSLPPEVVRSVADLVRAMNCYYSNLIEGHNTHPIDIERALQKDYSADPRKRDLQMEATAHVAVQQWIDEGGLRHRATTAESIIEIHRRFYAELPADFLWVGDPASGERLRVPPGELRQRDVRVGQHIAISAGAVPRFLERFELGYGGLGTADRVLAAAAAHHRLLWIHPFPDGNGRVARLMTHAMLLDALDTGAIWSVARGLARNEAAYKAHLAACDSPRRGDLDGRGNLSEVALAEFTSFFLRTCIDQVRFMRHLIEPDRLRSRILGWASEEIAAGVLPVKSGQVLEAALYRGGLKRGDIGPLLGITDRQSRRITSVLQDVGVLQSDGPRAVLRIAFPARLAARWMPGLFPEKSETP